MDFGKFFSPSGRMGVASFWATYIIYWAAIVAFAIAISQGESGALAILALAVYVVFAWVLLATGIKRAHDQGRSGWFVLVTAIPLIGMLWLGFGGSTSGPNEHGEPGSGSPFSF